MIFISSRSDTGATISASGPYFKMSIKSSREFEYGNFSSKRPSDSHAPCCCECQCSSATQRAACDEKRIVAHALGWPEKMP